MFLIDDRVMIVSRIIVRRFYYDINFTCSVVKKKLIAVKLCDINELVV